MSLLSLSVYNVLLLHNGHIQNCDKTSHRLSIVHDAVKQHRISDIFTVAKYIFLCFSRLPSHYQPAFF